MSYVEDAATRADQSGWGTADGGDDSDLTWNGGTTNFSVVSNKLVIPTDFARFYNRIGDNHSPPFTLTFDVTDLSTGGQFGGIEAIILSTGSEQEYRIAFRRDNGSGNTDLRIIMRDGSENVLASDDTLSDPGSDIEFKVEVTESGGDLTIKVKVWAQGAGEPGSWTLEHTESPATYTTGGIGLAGANQTSGSDMKFDNLVWEELAVAPTAPDNVSASEGDSPGELDASWDDNSSDEDHFNLKYRVQGSGDPFTVVQVPANVTSWTLSLTPGETYDLRVTAENANGESTFESGVTGTAKAASSGGSVASSIDQITDVLTI